MRSRYRWILASLLLWACCPGRANAHLVTSGLGPFYDGVAHVFVTPEDVLAVVALALLAGLGGKRCGRAVLFVLPGAWLAGALLGLRMPLSAGIPVVSAAITIGLGGMVAAGCRLPLALAAGAGLTCGLFKGSCNGAALAGVGAGGLAAGGIACAVFVIVALVAGQVAVVEQAWARIVVRVAGSWIGAIGLLMLGWAVRYG
jgi:hydrogenase/urease accessory protein HupE